MEAALLEMTAKAPPSHINLEGLIIPSPSSFVNVLPTRPTDLPRKKLDKVVFTNDHEARCAVVFKDLWRQGYYLSDAVKFGGDFLAYPGSLDYDQLLIWD